MPVRTSAAGVVSGVPTTVYSGAPIGTTVVSGTPTVLTGATRVVAGGPVIGGSLARTNVVNTGYIGGASSVGGALVGTTTIAPPIFEKAVIEEIPTESRIEYVPF